MEQIGTNSTLEGASLATTTEHAASSAHHTIDQFSEVARPTVSRVASSAHHLVDRLSGAVQKLGNKAGRLKDTERRLVGVSSSYVRAHPLKAAGIAVAAGFIISRLVSSHRSSNGSSHVTEE